MNPAVKMGLVAVIAAAVAVGGRAWAGPVDAPEGTVACVRVGDSTGLDDPAAKITARMLISSAENSTLAWDEQYGYIEYNVEGNAAENRGYTAGIVGFTSRTGDMLKLVDRYTRSDPDNLLAPFLPSLRQANGTPSRTGLGAEFIAAWQEAGEDPVFQKEQRDLADELYFDPAIRTAKYDGLGTLGQFIYVDAAIMHGFGTKPNTFEAMHAEAQETAQTPAQGGDEREWLDAFLDARRAAMKAEAGHWDTSRVDLAQRKFLEEGNFALEPPLRWSVYGDDYEILTQTVVGCQ